MKRCGNCNRRVDRPSHPFCTDQGNHVEPDVAQRIIEEIESDLTDRRGLRQEFEGIDPDTQDEIRDTWADLIRDKLDKP